MIEADQKRIELLVARTQTALELLTALYALYVVAFILPGLCRGPVFNNQTKEKNHE